jgi:hypothetical protein
MTITQFCSASYFTAWCNFTVSFLTCYCIISILGKEFSRHIFRKSCRECSCHSWAVIMRFRTAAGRVQSQFRACRSLGGHSDNGMHSLRGFRFPLPILIPAATLDSSSSFIPVWNNRPNSGLPLWSSDQSYWLEVQRSEFDSRRHKIFWEVVGLERGPLSLVSIIEELLGRKSSGCGLESREYGRLDQSRWPRGTLYSQK